MGFTERRAIQIEAEAVQLKATRAERHPSTTPGEYDLTVEVPGRHHFHVQSEADWTRVAAHLDSLRADRASRTGMETKSNTP